MITTNSGADGSEHPAQEITLRTPPFDLSWNAKDIANAALELMSEPSAID